MKTLFHIGLFIMAFTSCQKAKNTPIDKDMSAPDPVSDVSVTNTSGGAQISYTLPANKNLLYVKAEYTVNGETKEAKASFLANTITLEGFGDTNEHDVQIYAVSRAEKVSSPVVVKIKPLTPPVLKVRNSLTTKTSFGGFSVEFRNDDRANVVIIALKWDEGLKEWKQIDASYTALDSGLFKVRGQDSVMQRFGLVVRDRWNNLSDTMDFQLKPIYEEQLDKTKFVDIRKKYPIPQRDPLPKSGAKMIEAVDYSSSYPMKNWYDGNTGSMFHTKQNVDQPIWIPIDLGVKANFSRYKIWQRNGGFVWGHGNPHEWEIWGTNTPSDVNSWILLDRQIMVKPSGLPNGQNSNEDIDVANAGQEYEFKEGLPAVRYIAWKNIDCWDAIGGATGFFHLFELTLWGQQNK
ncbi:DUF4959 domain-containing protein [Niabella pedocola]|uniref:DUF4959 domain-containing protein n=1 Tax=Niabella pedocola TaxID=1752077 RepID=A0ABS8PN97_9BACT|nr:DUF5000 domain-containing lipoprotein [Niabella pedocola]MCD2422592.1 DUF4959 domain-containing protein [Niabella pedocola]